jgi:hypothetical protein
MNGQTDRRTDGQIDLHIDETDGQGNRWKERVTCSRQTNGKMDIQKTNRRREGQMDTPTGKWIDQ